MHIFMTHPEHGAMHVYSQWVRDDNLKNGWVISEPPKDGPKRELAEPQEPARRGPGRPRRNTDEQADD